MLKKDIKILATLNLASYINNLALITYFSMYKNLNVVEELDVFFFPIILALWILSPLALIFMTIYPIIMSGHGLRKLFKKELILYFSLNAIAYIILLSYTNTLYLSYEYFIKVMVELVLMIITLFILLKIYVSVPSTNCNYKNNINLINNEDKRNVKNIKKAVSIGITSLLSFIIFGLSLMLISSKDMSWHIDILAVLISSISFVIFIHKDYEKCTLAYLDKNKRMKVFKKEIICTAISYGICIIVSMNLIRVNNEFVRQGIFLISVIILYPIMDDNRLISIKYKNIRECLINDLVSSYKK
ncbi:MAG: hypothetical protein ACRC7R_10830 [Sarcina sp.]